jgi:predicted RNase H-like HicB family nuclease
MTIYSGWRGRRIEKDNAARLNCGISCISLEYPEATMTRELTVVIERDEDGYFVGTVPELRGCHTQAKSLDLLMRRIKEAAQLCIEVESESGKEELEFIGVQKIAV